MIDSYFRQPFQQYLVDPIARRYFVNRPANAITALACVSGLLVAPFLMFSMKLVALCMLAISGYLDVLDGTLARLQGASSAVGTVLDIVSDRIVEFAVVLGLYLAGPDLRAGTCLLMLGSMYICVTSFLVVGIFTENDSEKGFHYSPGLIERGETFLFFALMILFPAYFNPIVVLYTLLVFSTAMIRVIQFVKQRKDYASC